jgi:hypothetical protein
VRAKRERLAIRERMRRGGDPSAHRQDAAAGRSTPCVIRRNARPA